MTPLTSGPEWEEFFDGLDDGAVTWDGFDDAIVGSVERCGSPGPLVCYDYDLMVGVLVERDEMEHEDAEEYLDFNVVGAYVGEGTPFVFHRAPIRHREHRRCPLSCQSCDQLCSWDRDHEGACGCRTHPNLALPTPAPEATDG